MALRREVEGLRAAARLRAVIEQAKGVLVARHGITLDEAFERLRVLSQQNNVRLVEVAATVVGVAVPDATEPTGPSDDGFLSVHLPESPAASAEWRALRGQPDVRAGATAVLLDSLAASTTDGDEAAQLVLDLVAPHAVDGVVLFRVAADDSLRLVGQAGFPGDVVSAWRSIPVSMDIPFCRSVRTGEVLLLPDRATRVAQFPALAATPSAYEATVTVPIVDLGTVIGVVGLAWVAAQDFADGRGEQVAAAVSRVAPLLLRHVAAADPEIQWLEAVLGVHFDPWLVFEAESGRDGTGRDFAVRGVSSRVPGGAAWVGRRLRELWPSEAGVATGAMLAELATSGGAWTTTVTDVSDFPWGRPDTLVRAVRLGGRLVVVWRDPLR